MSNDTGLKYDGDKPPVELVPRQLVEAAARAFGYGEEKYAAYNWREGIRTRRLMGGLMRHLLAFQSGERIDPVSEGGSGLSHLDHAAASLAMLIATIDEGLADDDLLVLEEPDTTPGDACGRRPGFYRGDHADIEDRRPGCLVLSDWNDLPWFVPSRDKLPQWMLDADAFGPTCASDYYEEVK